MRVEIRSACDGQFEIVACVSRRSAESIATVSTMQQARNAGLREARKRGWPLVNTLTETRSREFKVTTALALPRSRGYHVRSP